MNAEANTETTQSAPTGSVAGVAGLFDTPDDIVRVARFVRDAGYRKWDCHTPYPVHGLDDAMGVKESKVPVVALTTGFVGLVIAIVSVWYVAAVMYPLNIGGKPFWAPITFVPVFFEVFILFAAFATLGSMIVFSRLLKYSSPLYSADVMREVTTTRFAVVLDSTDDLFDIDSAKKLLASVGCEDIRVLYNEDESG